MWKKYVITQQKIKVDMFKSFEHHENAIKRKVSLFFNIEYYLKKNEGYSQEFCGISYGKSYYRTSSDDCFCLSSYAASN